MEELMSFVSDVGFWILLTLYLLHRIEAKWDILKQYHSCFTKSTAEKGLKLD